MRRLAFIIPLAILLGAILGDVRRLGATGGRRRSE